MQPARITFQTLRWPYAAARASVYLALLAIIAFHDPLTDPLDLPFSSTAQPFLRRNSDIRADRWSADDLAWLRRHNPQSRLVLRIDRDVPFGVFRESLLRLRAAGYERVTIETDARPRRLFERRLETWRELAFDRSALREPPARGDFFAIHGLWE